jgi:hypothetical protein
MNPLHVEDNPGKQQIPGQDVGVEAWWKMYLNYHILDALQTTKLT